MTEVKDSGHRKEYASGAVRDRPEGKGRFDLLEPELLFRLANHYEAGAKKYDDRNWEKGIPVSDCTNSALRHLTKFLAGQNDEDHLAAAAWNIAAIMRFEKEGDPKLLDLPRYQNERFNAQVRDFVRLHPNVLQTAAERLLKE